MCRARSSRGQAMPGSPGLTGGNMQTHELHNPAMTLYSNGVSVTPLNIRATLVAWVHNRELAYQTTIAGRLSSPATMTVLTLIYPRRSWS